MLTKIESKEDKIAFQANLTQLREDSFRVILLLAGIFGWAWFSWSVWPQNRPDTQVYRQAWPFSALLLGLDLICYLLLSRHLNSSVAIFVVGLVSIVAGALKVFSAVQLAFLFILPVIFSGVLLGQAVLVLITLIVCTLMTVLGLIDTSVSVVEFIMPMLTVSLTAVALSISTRNLETTLSWALGGYRQAHQNELLARERKSELEQALTSLDNAMMKLQRTNKRLIQVSIQAEEARRLKQQFAQTISHELRTPLNLIVGFTETMIKSPEYYGGPLPSTYLRDLSVVYRNACHLQSLVNDVLDLARLESAYLSLDTEELAIAHVIEDAVNTARELVEGRGLTLKTSISPDLPPVWGDAVRLKQVLLNLLNNAARFTERGSVTVSASAGEGEVIVSVRDTGIGIPADSLTEVFESFRQLENPMQRRTEGAGLGLTISQQLINLHGGRIWVESEVGVGSTFFFSLPVQQVETLNLDRPLDVPAVEASMPLTEQQRVVLVVTRSPSSAALLSRYLAGYRTVVVTDLAQAQIAVQQIVPISVIVDTSTENAEKLRLDSLFNSPHMTVITCPLLGEEPLRKRLAADGLLIKPITRENLWDMLRQFGGGKNTVLVVDDDRDFVRLISRMLSDPMKRYTVKYAYSGNEALEMIRHNPPGVLLIDLNLSDMDGAQIIGILRSQPRFDSMRIVVITAYEEINPAATEGGTITVTKNTGLRPNEIVRWIQAGLEMDQA